MKDKSDSDMIRPDQEAALPQITPAEQRAMQKAEEEESLNLFLRAREYVTGETFELRGVGESPDFVVRRESGSYAGVELTRVYFNSPDPMRSNSRYDWGENPAIEEEILRLMSTKAELRGSPTSGWKYRKQTILVLLLMDVPLCDVAPSLGGIPVMDCQETGFREIWIADINSEDIDAFGGDIQLYGLFPKKWRGFHNRRNPQRKPYG